VDEALVEHPQHELVLSGRDGGVQREALLGLQVEPDAGDARDLPLQARDDLRGGQAARGAGLQIDEEPPSFRVMLVPSMPT
jgi:hypothetical protein